ncbi:hypothetical protein LIER_37655 [Lithospermum erythrorhizon]|uniref:Uncharacterized protein n=1 Tax=Lithospermum erythrorhizon TaxID=34254 RepID=A0AAV3PQH8_LITER
MKNNRMMNLEKKMDCLDILGLPEGCIATTISLTSPRDACRLALVASTFRWASQSDDVWDKFLPTDYKDIISRGNHHLFSIKPKKDLYFYLCHRPILIDAGTKSFSLEKSTGKKCFMLAARDLTIVWGDTPRYWRWISLPESRFSEVAELLDVCWLEVRGKIKTSMLSPNTTYSAYLVFTTKSSPHGFEYHAAESSVGISGQESETRAVCLDPDGAKRYRYQIVPRRMGLFHRRFGNIMRGEELSSPLDGNAEFPKQRDDMWTEVLLGEFYIKEGQDSELEISLMEVKSGSWKSGLIIEGIEIRPKGNTSD